MSEKNELQQAEKEKKENSKAVFVIVVVLISLLILGGLIFIGNIWYREYAGEKRGEEVSSFTVQTQATTIEQSTTQMQFKQNPIDFKALQETNSDLYAWIRVPGTRVDYPIAQGDDDEFYLHHDYLKNYLFAGTIYTEMCNNKDFNDPITLVYGHNMYQSEGTMFTTLHNFEDKDFFDSHDSFQIYTPDHILTYKVFSAFKYDNRHIMNSFDFTFEKQLEEFQQTMLNPHTSLKNVREGVTLDKESKVVVLSTCFLGDKSVRFLVCGVLVKDEPTK